MTSQNSNLLTLFRRALALGALCVVVAAITATWLASDPAEAGPGLDSRLDSRLDSWPHHPVVVPAPGHDGAAVTPGQETIQAANTGSDAPAKATRKTRKTKVITGKLNINTASEKELQMLPGVGPAKARRIVEFRAAHGKFARVKDLRRVKGFGYKSVTKLTPYLTVTGQSTLKVE